MNRKVFFLLIPFFALLFSFCSRAQVVMPIHKANSWLSIGSISADYTGNFSFAHNKDHKKIKQVIRIKAWDDHGAAAILTDPIVFKARQFYFTQSYCPRTYKHTPSRYWCRYNLRGPPAAYNS